MRKYIILFLLFFSYLLSAEPITNVRAMQKGKKIVVLYDLTEDIYVSQIVIEVDGKSRVIPNEFLKGDVDKDLKAGGDKCVEYDVLADYVDGFMSDNVVFEVQVSKYKAVDLGLSVKWATCNVGASKPYEYGDFFAWGEVEPKELYDWSTYKYSIRDEYSYGDIIFTKYCVKRGYGFDKIVLDPEDDAAIVNWGGAWRMPTNDEFSELKNNCTWDWTTQNGVKGYKVTGPSGNSIFLPAAGNMSDGTLFSDQSAGLYWLSSLLTDDSNAPRYADYVKFTLDDVKFALDIRVSYYYGCPRYCGLSVRPVCQ